jgi:hypothetical protein
LAELVVVWVIGLVEDEWCFSKLTFMKTKLRNQLTVHLELVIWMFRPKFFIIENFPFGTRTQSWKDNKIRYGEWWKIYWILQLHFVSMIHTCLNMVIQWIFIQPPFGPLKIRNENCFFYIDYAWLSFLLCRVSLMLQWAGPIWVGFNSQFQLCRQKLEWENQWFAKELIFFESL